MTLERKIRSTLLNNKKFKIEYPSTWIQINKNKFSWKTHSWVIPKFCNQLFDSNKYNWKEFSYYVSNYAPNLLNQEQYNWKNDSWGIVLYCPEKLDINKAYIPNIIETLPEYKNMSLKQIKTQAILNKL